MAKTTEFYARLESALTRKWGEKPTQQDIADRRGMRQTAVSAWKVGPTLPPMDKAIRLARMAGVCVEWLLAGDDPFLVAAVSLLRQLPRSERSRTLEMLQIKAEMQARSWPESEAEAIERVTSDTGRFRKPS